VLTWSGALGVAKSVTITYSVTVNNPDAGDLTMDNTVVTPQGTSGNCAPPTLTAATDLAVSPFAFVTAAPDPGCATHTPVARFHVSKSVSAHTTAAGGTVGYKITVTNTGQAPYTTKTPASFTDDLTSVLDDATYNDDANNGATYTPPTISWSGALAVGATVTITYTVTVDDPDNGDGRLDNVAVTPSGGHGPRDGGDCPANSSRATCRTATQVTAHTAAAPPTATTTPASTGNDIRLQLILAGLLLGAGSLSLLIGVRRRRTA
jgi:uncharacterized repeat protein (TIGR01451 family)